ncbi:F0F1 ATP synthase subunit epsilon [Dyadobacter frigoris]|uniref:F0F1 ATP synthase subunit epsilon n=1 Tax=Dyadobacter frigoris TaxID=2576211 RepID=UPI0024A2E41F|nr:F0F1 ATP synthase subunit epsilon [Dyadobacter frigoris]GLU57266.1 F0F1 ATP synthase subunit epsilon [Dyadobacter frigoris]
MDNQLMSLKILLPFGVFSEINEVSRMVMQTSEGSFGLLPHRLDCVAALRPGIFSYEIASGDTIYLAIDEGILVKAGSQVNLSVRNAIAGLSLGKLHEAVQKQFLDLTESERNVRSVMAKMEAGLLLSLGKFQKES